MMAEIIEQQKYNTEIQEQLKILLERGDVNQSNIAKAINYSPAVVSQYIKSDYNGDLKKLEDILGQYLKRFKTKKSHKKIQLEYRRTTIAEKINNIAKMCQYNNDIGVCIGKSGIGKTTAIKNYALETGGVILVDPDEKTSSRAVLKQIAKQLKLPDYKMQMEDFVADIIDKLKNSGRLIIIDEAENLDIHSFRILRKIHDRCEDTCGILFIGTETLHANLINLKGEFAYIANRVARLARLSELTTKDVEILVKQIFTNADIETIKHFEAIAEKNARILFHTLKTAKDFVDSGLELNKEVIISSKPGL